MLVFKQSYSNNNPLNVIFLCGVEYSSSEKQEKRNILASFLEEKLPNCRAVILEKNFIFGRTNMKHLAYEDIFLNGLAQVEELTSLFSNKIFIIHESISTAAELGMFAVNPSLAKKVCLMIPDDISIEEKKITGFIELAFINDKSKETKVGEVIYFYPDIGFRVLSQYKSDYYTYFHQDCIGKNLGDKILSFASDKELLRPIRFRNRPFNRNRIDEHSVDYSIDKLNETLQAFISPNVLKIQLLSLFYFEEYRVEMRKTKEIKDHVKYLERIYTDILRNTISDIEGLDMITFHTIIELKGSCISKTRQAVGYFIFLLQAAGLIELVQDEKGKYSRRRIQISHLLSKYRKHYQDYICAKEETMFGRLLK